MVEWWLWRHHLHEVHEDGVYRVIRLSRMFDKLIPVGYYLQGEEYQEFVQFVTELRDIPTNGESTGH